MKKPWYQYDEQHCNTVDGLRTSDTTVCNCTLHIGTVTTGKSAVFAGYYVTIETNGQMVTAQEPTLLYALQQATQLLQELYGITLALYGLRADFSESGLSFNSGWGYVPDIPEPVLMIASVR